MLNKVIIHARVASIESKATASDTTVVNLRAAVQRRKRNGEDQGADFVTCVAFGKTAEIAEQYLEKGREVLIEGRLHQNTWQAEDGTNRERLEIIIESFDFVGSARTETDEEALATV